MENFIVSARKYRPQNFSSVVGQSHITTTLKNAIKNNQLAHAFLFCGPRGIGKTTCARILAKTTNCENLLPDGEACNVCASCKSFNEGTSFNIHELDAASNNSVDDIRTLTEQVRFAPQSGKYKIYIIDEVHMLSSAAFNAFLKTLEEPPSYAIFILATTEKHKILPTILSRCQLFDFRRITIQDTVEHLQEIAEKEGVSADPNALHLIAQKSEGCMRDALSIFDKMVSFTNGKITYQPTLEHLNVLDYDYFFQMMDAIKQQDVAAALLIIDEILQKGFEGDNFISGMAAFIRDLLVCQDEKVIHLLNIPSNLIQKYKDTAALLSSAFLVSALQILTDVEINYRQARNKRLLVEITVIKLCYLQQAVYLISNDMTGEVIKKKLTEPNNTQKLRAAFPQPLQIKTSKNSTVTEIKLPPTPQKSIKNNNTTPAPAPSAYSTGSKLGGLEKLRSQLISHNQEETPEEISPLSEIMLVEKWYQYIELLQKAGKNSVATNLISANIALSAENEVIITGKNIIQQKFIEDEKLNIADFLKENLHQPQLSIRLHLDEDNNITDNQVPLTLSAKEQYLKMIEKYPLIKNLKDALHMDIDY